MFTSSQGEHMFHVKHMFVENKDLLSQTSRDSRSTPATIAPSNLVEHTLAPIFDHRSRVVVLGTMPSPLSREVGFYYGHPQNRFWKVLAALFDEPIPSSNDARTAFLLAHRIALWDVLASCEIQGAADASIKNPKPNDLEVVIQAAQINAVFTTGAKAASLYRRFNKPLLERLPHTALPSTSAANARMHLPELVEAYRPIITALDEAT